MSKLLGVILGYFSELLAAARLVSDNPAAEVAEQIDLFMDGNITAVNQEWAAPIFEKITLAVGNLTDQTDAMPSLRSFLALACPECGRAIGNMEIGSEIDRHGHAGIPAWADDLDIHCNDCR